MSKKKGLSVEEKRSRLLDLFHEKKDVFLLKELEKMAPKEKGIVMQSVKDILMSLVSDELVDSDKIGSSVYFWSFPAKALNSKMQKIKELKEKMIELNERSKQLDSELKKVEINAKDIAIRDKALKELQDFKQRRDELKTKLDAMKDCDPEVVEQMKKDCDISKEAINRWTDNVFLVKSWCKKKFNVEEAVINKQLGIPEDFDYPE